VLLAIRAYQYTDITTGAVFKYSGILWAGVVSFMIWGEIQSLLQNVGSLLIIVGGIWGLLLAPRRGLTSTR
jgi:drug/metabolite transporter (DMT)-like permease